MRVFSALIAVVRQTGRLPLWLPYAITLQYQSKAFIITVSSVARDVPTSAAADFVHFCSFCTVFKSRYIIQGIIMHIDL